MKLLSIITPTHNRAPLLKRCFASLLAQTSRQFEWIIVDDGSTDDTEAAAASFLLQAPEMRIHYLRKENGGKHTAMNAAHPLIHGDYVLILDDDDCLIPSAVEEILQAWARYDQPRIGVVVFLEGYSETDPFAEGKREGVPFDMFHEHTITRHNRDCCDIYRTEAFLRFPYPVFAGETFLSESILWNKMAPEYQIVYVNKVIYLADYLEDGLTRSGRAMRIRMPRGGMYAANEFLDRRYPLKLRLKNALLYNCYGYFAGVPFREVRDKALSPVTVVLTRPLGWLLYRHWKRQYGKQS